MIKGTPELIAQRREEIVNACERLYQTMSFRDITLKEIGSVTSFSRPTIYNYFQTKEEIFLALFEREYDRWNAELGEILRAETMTSAELADRVAASLQRREQLLKLLAMNNYDMEAMSRPELLVSFKRAYGESLAVMRAILEKFCPNLDAEAVLYVFFPFLFGVYPYASVTPKQREAMRAADVDFVEHSIYEIVRNCLIRLLDDPK